MAGPVYLGVPSQGYHLPNERILRRVAEIADEIRRRLQTREAASATSVAGGGIQTTEQVQPELSVLIPLIEHDRKVYRLSDLLGFEGEAYIIHLYRSLAKRQPDDAILRRHSEALKQ